MSILLIWIWQMLKAGLRESIQYWVIELKNDNCYLIVAINIITIDAFELMILGE